MTGFILTVIIDDEICLIEFFKFIRFGVSWRDNEIGKATALALSANSGGPATDPDANRQQAAFYYGMSEQNKRAFPNLINVRTAS